MKGSAFEAKKLEAWIGCDGGIGTEEEEEEAKGGDDAASGEGRP